MRASVGPRLTDDKSVIAESWRRHAIAMDYADKTRAIAEGGGSEMSPSVLVLLRSGNEGICPVVFLLSLGRKRHARVKIIVLDSACWSAALKHALGLLLLALGLWLAGCARFEPRPISAADSAAELEGRTLEDAALKAFLEKGLKRELSEWPATKWDFEMLTLAALYYHPSLEVARAQWAVAQGGEKTAGQRPNPTLTVTPTYNFTTFVPSPWDPVGFIDIPIETAGKRKYRRAQAANLSQAARLNIAVTAWQVRSAVRSSLLDFAAAGRREAALEKQVLVQQEILQRQQQQAELGAIAP